MITETFKTDFPEMFNRDEIRFFHMQNVNDKKTGQVNASQGNSVSGFEKIFNAARQETHVQH